jgi:putative two-component system response regulator
MQVPNDVKNSPRSAEQPGSDPGQPRGPDDERPQNERLTVETDALVEALLTHALDVRGNDLSLTRRVADRADAIAHCLGLDQSERSVLRKSAALRDIGKAGLSDRIMKKSGPLTADEFEEVREHMLPEDDVEDSEHVKAATQIAYYHHERYDGTGYPEQLRAEAIPLGARVLAVAEAYEAMMFDAAWRRARGPEEALAEVKAESGRQFDPTVVIALEQSVVTGQPGWTVRRLAHGRPAFWADEPV